MTSRTEDARTDCHREAEVIDAIASARWPDRLNEDLRRHIVGCAVCGDVAEVGSLLSLEQQAAWCEARTLPSADVVWLRAQARARADAVRRASHPIAVLQAAALACVAAVMSLTIGAAGWWVWTRTGWLTTLPAASSAGLDMMGLAVRGTLLAIGLWLILAPVAVYLAAADE